MNTRDRIIYESIKLFSIHGFDTVSTRMIARAVSLSDTALYKHFASKQEIFNTCIEICKQRFVEKKNSVNTEQMHWSDVEQVCMEMFRFLTEDEWIVLFRKVLVVEQFRNPEMAKLYQDFFIHYEVDRIAALFVKLMEIGVMRKQDPAVAAMELYAPFFMYFSIESLEEKQLEKLQQHIQRFCESNSIHRE